jgi:hypothetical protein
MGHTKNTALLLLYSLLCVQPLARAPQKYRFSASPLAHWPLPNNGCCLVCFAVVAQQQCAYVSVSVCVRICVCNLVTYHYVNLFYIFGTSICEYRLSRLCHCQFVIMLDDSWRYHANINKFLRWFITTAYPHIMEGLYSWKLFFIIKFSAGNRIFLFHFHVTSESVFPRKFFWLQL